MQKRSFYHQQSYAEQYDTDRFGKSFGQILEDLETQTFLSLISGSKGVILDIGAGTGKLSLAFSRGAYSIISIDGSLEMLKIARAKAREQGLKFHPIICDAHRLCFRDNSFTAVVSSRVLMHLTDIKTVFTELCRVAEFMVVDFPPVLAFSGIDSLYRRIKSRFTSETQCYNVFFVRNIIRELERCGFSVVDLQKRFFLPFAFHRWVDRPKLTLGIEKACQGLGLVRLFGSPVTIKATKQAVHSRLRSI